jgi:putative hemolysin
MWGITFELLLVALLLVLNGALAMAEMALVSARRSRLASRGARGDSGATAALALLAEPTRFLSTVQIGITLVGILLGAISGATLAGEISARLQGVSIASDYANSISLALVVAATTYLSLVLGELVPKRIAQNAPEAIASFMARPMRLLATLTAPLVAVLTISTEGLLRILRIHASGEPAITEEDVRLLIVQGTEAGVIQPAERDVVEGAFELGDRTVEELMTPRVLVAWLDLDAERAVTLGKIAAAPHGYYPASRGELDRVAGVLAMRDLIPLLLRGDEVDLAHVVRAPVFVPAQMRAYQALEHMKQAGSGMALVVDETGGIDGLLTASDLVEVLAGHPTPETAAGGQVAIQREDGSWLLDGLMPLFEAADLFGITLSGDRPEAVTLGGLAMNKMARVPVAGDRFDWHGIAFEVIDMDGRRVDKLLAIRLPGSGSSSA